MHPPIDKNVHLFERSAGKSISVLVKHKNFKYPVQGYYWHELKFWTLSNVQGDIFDIDIEEWWEIPPAGSGNKL